MGWGGAEEKGSHGEHTEEDGGCLTVMAPTLLREHGKEWEVAQGLGRPLFLWVPSSAWPAPLAGPWD